MSLLLTAARSADFVIMVSVDGLRPAAIEQLRSGGELAHFARMQGEGVWTHNARADYDSTSTVPNHVSMATGRGVAGDEGHNYTSNGNPAESDTLHQNKGSYLASVFDVAHDHGLTTAFHRSKSKLAIIDQSYPTKLDITRFSVTGSQSGSLMDLLEADLLAAPVHLTFLHLVDPDPVGHGSRWETPEYFEAVRRIDAYLGRLLELVEANEPYAGRTTIILTADHGGAGASHTDVENPENYTIPSTCGGQMCPQRAISTRSTRRRAAIRWEHVRRTGWGCSLSAMATWPTWPSMCSGYHRSRVRQSMRYRIWPSRRRCQRARGSWFDNCRRVRCSCAGGNPGRRRCKCLRIMSGGSMRQAPGRAR
ncbi:MAG: alkaline phosphatase family protein [Verrucomicrobiales bacterium]